MLSELRHVSLNEFNTSFSPAHYPLPFETENRPAVLLGGLVKPGVSLNPLRLLVPVLPVSLNDEFDILKHKVRLKTAKHGLVHLEHVTQLQESVSQNPLNIRHLLRESLPKTSLPDLLYAFFRQSPCFTELSTSLVQLELPGFAVQCRVRLHGGDALVPSVLVEPRRLESATGRAGRFSLAQFRAELNTADDTGLSFPVPSPPVLQKALVGTIAGILVFALELGATTAASCVVMAVYTAECLCALGMFGVEGESAIAADAGFFGCFTEQGDVKCYNLHAITSSTGGRHASSRLPSGVGAFCCLYLLRQNGLYFLSLLSINLLELNATYAAMSRQRLAEVTAQERLPFTPREPEPEPLTLFDDVA